jgi:hypothetical protein
MEVAIRSYAGGRRWIAIEGAGIVLVFDESGNATGLTAGRGPISEVSGESDDE